MLRTLLLWIILSQLLGQFDTVSPCPKITLNSLGSSSLQQCLEGGSITYYNYSNHASCHWEIPNRRGYEVEVKFTEFLIEGKSHVTNNCDYDNLTLTWITLNGIQEIRTFCGTNTPKLIYTTRKVKVDFKSDGTGNFLGFRISFCYSSINPPGEQITNFISTTTKISTSVPPRTTTTTTTCSPINFQNSKSGTIASNIGSANYSPNSYCFWTIPKPPKGYYTTLNILQFDLEDASSTSGDCDKDYVRIVVDSNESANQKYCGSNLPSTYDMIGINEINITFSSDDYVNRAGFQIQFHYIKTKSTCGKVYYSPSESFIDSHIGFKNSSNKESEVICIWEIPSPSSVRKRLVLITFPVFKLENSCEFVNVTLRYHGVNSGAVFCGENTPQPFLSRSSVVVIFRNTDQSSRDRFRLKFSYTDNPNIPQTHEVQLVGLKSNNSYLLVNQSYPAIKCETWLLDLTCHLTFAADANSNFVKMESGGVVVFQNEGTKVLQCVCTKSKNKQYFSFPWKVHIGSSAPITSFYQSSNFVVTCFTNYHKEKNISIILDGAVLATSKNTNDAQFSLDFHSKIKCDHKKFNGKLITCRMENHWGKVEKSYYLSMKYEVKLVGLKSYLVLNKQYPSIKCKAEVSGLLCNIVIVSDNSTIVEARNGAVVFRNVGTKLIKCSCGNSQNKQYCSAEERIHIGSTAQITSFKQSSNYVVSAYINYNKDMNVSIILDGTVLYTSTNTNNGKFSHDLESKVNCNPDDFDGKVIICRTENQWGKEEKSLVLNIKYSSKPKHVAINGLYGDVVSVDVDANVTCTCWLGNPKPKRITFIKTTEIKNFFVLENRIIPKHEGNYNVTCQVELENGNLVHKTFRLKVEGKGNNFLLIAMVASVVVNLLLIIILVAILCCKIRNKNQKRKQKSNEQKCETSAYISKMYEIGDSRQLPKPPKSNKNDAYNVAQDRDVQYEIPETYNSIYETTYQ